MGNKGGARARPGLTEIFRCRNGTTVEADFEGHGIKESEVTGPVIENGQLFDALEIEAHEARGDDVNRQGIRTSNEAPARLG